jgi:hypothetical protein
MASPEALPIERSVPENPDLVLVSPGMVNSTTEAYKSRQTIVPLIDYLKRVGGKPRGNETGGREDLNSHEELLIIKEGEEINASSLLAFQDLLRSSGLNVELLGLHSIGNSNQVVTNMVHGLDETNPNSGYERPVVAEGPHMILAPFAHDENGQLHVFRIVQMRLGEAVIDTPRGFADQAALESGEQLYDIENSAGRVEANMQRILGEEAGDVLKIKRIIYFGSPRVNSSFVISKSAIFGVEVDYEAFVSGSKIITGEELRRRVEQFKGEGIVGGVLDIPLESYIEFKRDSSVPKDMAADFGTDTVVIDFLAEQVEALREHTQRTKAQLSAEVEANKKLKKEHPEIYLDHRLAVSESRYPDRAENNRKKVKTFKEKTM